MGPPLLVLRPFAPPPPGAPWLPGHRGVDLAAAAGDAVRADAAGRVTFAGVVAGQGVVVVAHSARLRSTFEPVRATVRTGDNVPAGARLGRLAVVTGPLGRGPRCPGRPCLHWGMLLDGRDVDPLVVSGLLSVPVAGTARLLPLVGPPTGPAAPGPPGPGGGAAAAGGVLGGTPRPPGGAVAVTVGAAVTSAGAGAVVAAVRLRRRRAMSRAGP
ncbi:MAG: peptidoglycan DD-metalloendopeptidase family protein [Actinomycetes bacterium]